MKTNTQNIVTRIIFLCSFFYFLNSHAQAPDKMSYQAVIRNASNALVANAGVGMKISILQTSASGTVVYAESQTPTTNTNGLASLQIGDGTVLSGNMANIDWSAGPYFIKTETDPTGGSSYTITATSQLMSVPYALYAKTSGGSSSGWGLTGNGSTNPATNFIGTTDPEPLIFKTNNVQSGKIDFDSTIGNTSFGYQALFSNTTGINNTANGYQALFSNTTGDYNTANGIGALYSNTTGILNTANGDNALRLNTTGNANTANGVAALYNNTTGSNNTANGYFALFKNTTGNLNTAIGERALFSNTTGSYQTAIGFYALHDFNSTGFVGNTAVGNMAMQYTTNGYDNTAVGDNALSANTTGYRNTVVGHEALLNATIANNNTAVGNQAMYNATTGGNNTAVGLSALYSNTTAWDNTAIGMEALKANTTGTGNTANGRSALLANTTGTLNTATGVNTLYSNTTGNENTANGSSALRFNTTGNYNTAIGTAAGYNLTSGDNNIFIGNSVQPNVSNTASNQLNIGNWIYGNNGQIGIGSTAVAKNPTRAQLVVDGGSSYVLGTYGYLGQSGVTGQIGGNTVTASIWASNRIVAEEFDATSDARIKRNITPLPNNSLATLAKINVVNYNKLSKAGASNENGVIAQELEKIMPDAVKQSEGDIYNDATQKWEVVKDFRTLNYQSINLLTTKAVQELNQKVEEQQKLINSLEKRLEALENKK